uniref:Putative reverse transcriptase domain-containing protein n=1 Tax=Tanacetum cinerariifolium TaxID=118510 RepID=A0A6L2P3G8_TANCI|nr:putative reverse transcriptase domain-containing protein [Tanacetum cinerariifolium]
MLEEMLGACVIDFGSSWDRHFSLVEFSYNNSYHVSINVASYEALYERKRRSPVYGSEVGDSQLTGLELICDTTKKIIQIKNRLLTACIVRFRKRKKLSPRYIGPFKIIARVVPVAYTLELPEVLKGIHNTSHVSNLKTCLAEGDIVVLVDEIQLDDKLHMIKEAVEVVDREVKRLKQSRITIVKVHWNSQRGLEFTWEREDQIKKKYPHRFTKAYAITFSLCINTALKPLSDVSQYTTKSLVPLGNAKIGVLTFALISEKLPQLSQWLRNQRKTFNEPLIVANQSKKFPYLCWLHQCSSTLNGFNLDRINTKRIRSKRDKFEQNQAKTGSVAKPEKSKVVAVDRARKNEENKKRMAKNAFTLKCSVSVVGPTNTTVSPTLEKSLYVDPSQYPDDPNMPALKDITYSDEEEDVGAEADFNNLETTIIVSPIPTSRVHKDNHVTQITGDLSLATQTRKPKRVHQALKDPSWIEAIQEELLQFKMKKVEVLVDLPNRKRIIGHNQEEGIDYEEVFDLVAMIEAIRLFLAYASFMGFMVYQMDVKSAFLYRTIVEEQKPDGIFISKDKYVAEILRKFRLTDGKSASTPTDTKKPLLKDPDESIDCLPNEEIFTELARMGYEKPSIKLTFYKAFSSAQWKFFMYTILQCMSAKRTTWNEFGSSMASALMIRAQVGDLSSHTTKYSSPALTQKVFANMKRVGKGFFRVETPLFEGMLAPQQAADAVNDVVDGSVPTDDVADDVPTADAKSTPPSPPPTTTPPPLQELPSTSQVAPTPPPSPISPPASPRQQQQPSQPTTISMDLLNTLLETCTALTRRVENLEKVGTTQRIESSADTIMDDQEDAFKKGEIIANIDADEDVTLKDVDAIAKDIDVEKNDEVEKNAYVQGRLEESQAKVYHIELEHADKVLSMQDDELEPAELQEVIEVVTTAKLMIEVVTAATTTITAAPSAAKRRKRAVIRDPEETATPSTIVRSEPKSKDKGKGIMLNKNINWDDVIEQVKEKGKQDNVVLRCQALKRKPQTEAQTRKNMMVYLQNMVGFKMDYFKGMSYDDIRLIFKKYFNSNVAFLKKSKEEFKEEESRALKRKTESSEEKAVKKQKLDEEVEELKKHLQIVPNDDDDVYTEDTPLVLKVPVIDYEIYSENNKPYYKIIRADESYQLFLSFLSLLRNFDREDLEMLWQIVKEIFSSSKPKNFSDDYLLTTLTYMFEKPDMILLVERRYPLTRFTLEQMLNNVRLEVKEESEVSFELLRFVSFRIDAAEDFKQYMLRDYYCWLKTYNSWYKLMLLDDAADIKLRLLEQSVVAGVALVDETQERNDQDMFDTSIFDDEEVVAEKEVSTAEVVPTASDVVTTASVETSKPKAKGIVIQELSETPTPTPIDSSQQSSKAKDKGKAKMIELKQPLKRKD